MATISTENFEKNASFRGVLTSLYGGSAAANACRFGKLAARHQETFGAPYRDFFSSPGRIEIVGNHTDHNAGKVLAAAITVDTLAAVSPREDRVVEVKSENYPMMRISLDDLAFRQSELGTSVALIKGVAEYFARAGKATGGFTACMDSCVPKGSGVSSSSSFELIIAEIFNVYYNDGELSPIFMAKASQYAENVYFGKPSGLMDQSAIALGGVNMIDFRSFDAPDVLGAKWDFDDLEIYVVATGGDHSDLTDDYAAIPAEMKAVAAALGGKVLRDVPAENCRPSGLGGRRASGGPFFASCLRKPPPFRLGGRVEAFPRDVPAENRRPSPLPCWLQPAAGPHTGLCERRYARYPGSRLRNGVPTAQAAIRLVLLGSPPDTVHGATLRGTDPSSLLTGVRRHNADPGAGIHPCCSGLQVQGTANSPTSAALPRTGRISAVLRKAVFDIIHHFFRFINIAFIFF